MKVQWSSDKSILERGPDYWITDGKEIWIDQFYVITDSGEVSFEHDRGYKDSVMWAKVEYPVPPNALTEDEKQFAALTEPERLVFHCLMQHERDLSDGYGYYTGNIEGDEKYDTTVIDIAKEIVAIVRKADAP